MISKRTGITFSKASYSIRRVWLRGPRLRRASVHLGPRVPRSSNRNAPCILGRACRGAVIEMHPAAPIAANCNLRDKLGASRLPGLPEHIRVVRIAVRRVELLHETASVRVARDRT